MAKLSLAEVSSLSAAYILQAKVANPTYTPSYSDWTGALDKIAKIYNIIDEFEDNLPELEGEMLPLGKTIEEVHEDLFLPNTFDPTGANSKAPKDPTFRPACWSYALDEKTFKSTVRMNKFEQSCNSAADLASLTATHAGRMVASRNEFRKGCKRQLLATVIKQILKERTEAATYATSTAYATNAVLQSTGSSGIYGIVVKPITSTSYATTNTWNANVAAGYIIVLLNVVTLAKPVDTATGEAFLQKIKDLSEVASDSSEGYSLNGNTIGAVSGLTLYEKFGIESVLDIQVKAGAFNLDKLVLPLTQKPIKDLGDADSTVYAVLADTRGLKLHPNYIAVRNDPNGEGDFINELMHNQDTAFYSRNTMFIVFKSA